MARADAPEERNPAWRLVEIDPSALVTTYEPRAPAQPALYELVHDHFETFRAEAASLRDGEGSPRFVDDEFRGG